MKINVRAMAGSWPPYHCATEPKDHRGVAAYCATTPIWIDMEGPFGPYNKYRENRIEDDIRSYNSNKRINKYIRSYMKHYN